MSNIPTLAEFVPEYMEHHVHSLKPSSQLAQRQILNRSVLPLLGSLKLTEIKTRHAGDLRLYCTKLGLENKTINDHLSVLSTLLKCAIEREYLESMIYIKRLPKKRVEVKFLTGEQVDALIASAEGPFMKALIKFAVNTGLRIGELRGLYSTHIDLENSIVRVINSFSGREVVLGDDKTGVGRTVPLNSYAKQAVEEIRALNLPGPFFFSGGVDKQGKTHEVAYKDIHERGIVKAAKKAGIWKPEFGFHTLRHTYASHLIRAGVHIAEIQKFLGHTEIVMTMRYAHLSPDSGHDSVALLEKIFSSEG